MKIQVYIHVQCATDGTFAVMGAYTPDQVQHEKAWQQQHWPGWKHEFIPVEFEFNPEQPHANIRRPDPPVENLFENRG